MDIITPTPSQLNSRHDDGNELVRPAFPPAFVGALVNNAFKTLNDYLEANGAPKEVLDLLDHLMMLRQHETTLEITGGLLASHDNEELPNQIEQAIDLITRLGGEWHGGYSVYGVEPAVSWPTKDNGPVQFFRN